MIAIKSHGHVFINLYRKLVTTEAINQSEVVLTVMIILNNGT
jgi:hypothetical protein